MSPVLFGGKTSTSYRRGEDSERSKAKNLLKIIKAVVSCAREDQTGSKAQDQIALN